MRNIKEVLAYNLRRLRGGRTQLDIATDAGIPVTTYQRMESGSYWPEHRNIEKVARALGREEIDLFHDPTSKYRITATEAMDIINKQLGQPEPVKSPKEIALERSILESEELIRRLRSTPRRKRS